MAVRCEGANWMEFRWSTFRAVDNIDTCGRAPRAGRARGDIDLTCREFQAVETLMEVLGERWR